MTAHQASDTSQTRFHLDPMTFEDVGMGCDYAAATGIDSCGTRRLFLVHLPTWEAGIDPEVVGR